MCRHRTPNRFVVVELKARRLWLTVGWMLVLLVIYLSLTPAPLEVPIEQGDKLSHMVAYLTLTSWFANLYECPAQRVGFALGFAVLGVGLEFLQGWTEYRSSEGADMVASSTGVAVGWVLAPPRLPHYLFAAERLWRGSPHP